MPMTNDRAATAMGPGPPDDSAMDHARGQETSAGGLDLDPDVRRFIRAMAESVARHPQFNTAPLPQVRRWAEEVRAPWRRGGPTMLDTRDLTAPTRHDDVRVRIHRPAPGGLPGLVYLHGGGWTIFSIDTHDRVMREYAARAGCCVIGIDYALSPECRFPVALEQVVDVVQWLASEGEGLGIDARRLAIGGDSAGANLSLAASLVLRDLQSAPALRAMILNYGAFISRCSTEACRRFDGPEYMLGCEEMSGYWRNYLRNDQDAEDPLACPLFAALQGLPPAFLAIAECDILAEQNVEMARRLQAAGVPTQGVVYPGASHSFIEAMSIAAVSDQALADASGWLRQVLLPAGPGQAAGIMA
jgi:acetyl esterase